MATYNNTIIKHRSDTLANWNNYNPVINEGEIVFIKDTNQIKIGDGNSRFNALSVYGDVTTITTNVSSLQTNVSSLQTNVSSLQTTTANQNERISDLESELEGVGVIMQDILS